MNNKLPAKWREYSPNGKRRKIAKIPFGDSMPDIRAMGTKRVPVISSRTSFSIACSSIGNIATFQTSTGKRIGEYSLEELKAMTPDQRRALVEREKRLKREDAIENMKNIRGGVNTSLATLREGRSWLLTADKFNLLPF